MGFHVHGTARATSGPFRRAAGDDDAAARRGSRRCRSAAARDDHSRLHASFALLLLQELSLRGAEFIRGIRSLRPLFTCFDSFCCLTADGDAARVFSSLGSMLYSENRDWLSCNERPACLPGGAAHAMLSLVVGRLFDGKVRFFRFVLGLSPFVSIHTRIVHGKSRHTGRLSCL